MEYWSIGVLRELFRKPALQRSITPSLHRSNLLSFPDLPVAENDKFRGRKLFETHRAKSVNLARSDAGVSPQSELTAVIEASRRVHHDSGRIDAADELSSAFVVLCHDCFCVFGPIALDMLDRLVQIGDDPTDR